MVEKIGEKGETTDAITETGETGIGIVTEGTGMIVKETISQETETDTGATETIEATETVMIGTEEIAMIVRNQGTATKGEILVTIGCTVGLDMTTALDLGPKGATEKERRALARR